MGTWQGFQGYINWDLKRVKNVESFVPNSWKLAELVYFFLIWMKPISEIGPSGELELDHLEVDEKALKMFSRKSKSLGQIFFLAEIALKTFLQGTLGWLTVFQNWNGLKKQILPNTYIFRFWKWFWKFAFISLVICFCYTSPKGGLESILAGGSHCWWIFHTFYWSCRRQRRHIQRLSNDSQQSFHWIFYTSIFAFPLQALGVGKIFESNSYDINDEKLKVFFCSENIFLKLG